jgi:hypothetical protein
MHGLGADVVPELFQHGGRSHVADVQRDRRLLEDPHASLRQRPAAAREVRIAEQRDQ